MSQSFLGSLTTQFTPPAECSSSIKHIYMSPGDGVFAGPLTPGTCFPSGYNPTVGNYYSPAYVCAPSRDSYACNTNCSHPWEATRVCKLELTSGHVWPEHTKISTNAAGETVTLTVEPGGVDAGVGAINAFGIQIRFKAGDVPTASTSSSTTATTPLQTGLTSTPPDDGGPNLSPGAIAGIAVGSFAGILLLIGIGWAVFVMGKRRGRHGGTAEATSSIVAGGKAWDSNVAEVPGNSARHEMGSGATYAYGHVPPQELAAPERGVRY
ncbi:hypothetical protein QBC34DRAFT_457435 [Podospora aff. communis PSN243]|uniref:Mid2 domain-containing protein n=1 Tax=Podospora aff. communis PSN243 TaxID=3040156 RepID=A0AAV9FWB9_9PEZI|nr:hypothetical protein QBC34DRAFT_457435 [Podospora aff. communis PSN243]